MLSSVIAIGIKHCFSHFSLCVVQYSIMGIIMLALRIAGAFLIPDGMYRSAFFTLSGTSHIAFATMPPPNDPPNRLMRSYPKSAMTSPAHLP